MKASDLDELALSTGQFFYAHGTILGLRADGKLELGEQVLYEGYDGTAGPQRFTPAERREIAEHMIGVWKNWGGLWATSAPSVDELIEVARFNHDKTKILLEWTCRTCALFESRVEVDMSSEQRTQLELRTTAAALRALIEKHIASGHRARDVDDRTVLP